MATNRPNSPATDSAETLRDLVGEDPTATFEDDPTFVDSNPVGNASSENLVASEDEDEEDDFEDDTEEDEEDDEDDSDEEDDAAETGAGLSAAAEADDDSDDDGRENAVDGR